MWREKGMEIDNQHKKWSIRNILGFLTSLGSFFFLVPGVYLSMLSISSAGSMKAELPHVEYNFLGIPSVEGTELHRMGLHVFDTTRSILKTVNDLWTHQYHFVAAMIILFSVIIPFVKGSLLTYVFVSPNPIVRKKIFIFIKSIGKWSMCDVFITAIFLAYLGTGASQTHNVQNVAVMGYSVNVDVFVGMTAQLQIGFWCFLTYCLILIRFLFLELTGNADSRL
jgi:hypothetical protein